MMFTTKDIRQTKKVVKSGKVAKSGLKTRGKVWKSLEKLVSQKGT